MEYYSALKNEGDSYMYSHMGEPWGHYAEWNEPDTKGQTLYDSINMRYVE